MLKVCFSKALAKFSTITITITITYLTHLPALPGFQEKIGLLSAADVQKLNTRRSHKMSQKFDEHDANDLSRIIRRRRPHWNHNGIMGFLQQAALRGASLAQVMSAAEKTWNNQKATTPAAIMWPEHWANESKTSQTAGNIMAPRLCVECTPARKYPQNQMTKQPHGWVCNNHQEESE